MIVMESSWESAAVSGEAKNFQNLGKIRKARSFSMPEAETKPAQTFLNDLLRKRN